MSIVYGTVDDSSSDQSCEGRRRSRNKNVMYLALTAACTVVAALGFIHLQVVESFQISAILVPSYHSIQFKEIPFVYHA